MIRDDWNGKKGDHVKGSLLKRKLHNHDLKNAHLPNAIESNIQISKILLKVMGLIAHINFEEKKLKTWSWKLGLKTKTTVENWKKKKTMKIKRYIYINNWQKLMKI
jgi:hypothetical protein